MGRAGYMVCLVILGVVMLSVSCLAVFGAAGAITAERGNYVPPEPVAAAPKNRVAPVPEATKPAERRSIAELGTGEATKPTAPLVSDAPVEKVAVDKVAPATKAEATRPAVSTPNAARTGPESNIAQRLDREAVGGGLKLRALGAAKTTQGERSVLAIYVRMENDGSQVLRIDPTNFKLLDRGGNRFAVTRAVEQMFPPVELKPRAAAGQQGELTEGNLTFEIPKTAAGLALVYELAAGGQPLRIPLPPEFG